MRCLRRRLSDVVYRQLAADAQPQQVGPGGHSGATLLSSAADLPWASALRTSHFPDPYPRPYPRRLRHPTALRPSQAPHRDGAPEVSPWTAPPDERR
jgi:transposase